MLLLQFQGSIESASVGEIKLSFRKSLVKLGVSVISKDPKLQLLISDIELVMRPSGQSKETAKSRKSRSTGKGKWFVITSAARFLSVWVTDLIVKVFLMTDINDIFISFKSFQVGKVRLINVGFVSNLCGFLFWCCNNLVRMGL